MAAIKYKRKDASVHKLDMVNVYDGMSETQIDQKIATGLASVNSKIGDTTLLPLTDLVTTIIYLSNQFMSSIKYENKKLVLTYKNGSTDEINLSQIITATDIGELANVNDSGISDGQFLKYSLATQKYIPATIDLDAVLLSANEYTRSEIQKLNKSSAISCDSKPTYNDSGDRAKIVYTKGGNEKTTYNLNTWFYYTNSVDSKMYQTIWIDAVEFTLAVANEVDFDDFVSKTNDVVETYTGEEIGDALKKVATIASIKAYDTLLSTTLSGKVNTSDIEKELNVDDDTKVASASAVKTLNDTKFANTTDVTNAGKYLVVNDSGSIDFKAIETMTNAEIEALL